MKTLRELLTEECVAEGWDVDDNGLEEALRECFTSVHHEPKSSHRWREEFWNVAKIDDSGVERLFMYTSYSNTGENDAEGCGYYFEGIDNVIEVMPEKYTATRYVPLK